MRRLDDGEIDAALTRNGIGVLALFDGDYPYAIPMSFGYDGDVPLFAMQLGIPEESRKRRCLAATDHVCFTVYEQVDPDAWRSVVLRGSLSAFDGDSERAFAALAANAEFASDLGLWGVPLDDVDLSLYELVVDERTGREFSTSLR